MGAYGSPDTGKLYTEEKIKETKKEGIKPLKNLWVWIVIIIVDILFYLVSNKDIDDVLTILALNSLIMFIISVVSLGINLVKKRKIGNDIKLIVFNIIAFFIFAILLAP